MEPPIPGQSRPVFPLRIDMPPMWRERIVTHLQTCNAERLESENIVTWLQDSIWEGAWIVSKHVRKAGDAEQQGWVTTNLDVDLYWFDVLVTDMSGVQNQLTIFPVVEDDSDPPVNVDAQYDQLQVRTPEHMEHEAAGQGRGAGAGAGAGSDAGAGAGAGKGRGRGRGKSKSRSKGSKSIKISGKERAITPPKPTSTSPSSLARLSRTTRACFALGASGG